MFAQLAAWDWSEIFEPPTVVFVVGGLIGLAAIIFPQWRKVREIESSSRLKLKMIDRGFSADEIERVLRAGVEDQATESR